MTAPFVAERLPTYELARYKIWQAASGKLNAEAPPGVPELDFRTYSRAKYGDLTALRRYGRLLGQLAYQHLQAIGATNQPVVVVGTPYKRVRNAAAHLAEAVCIELAAAGVDVIFTTIYQLQVASGDYGLLSDEQRDVRNGSKQRILDPAAFASRHVIVVDDIVATGSIIRSVTELIDVLPVLGRTVLTLAMIEPSTVRRNQYIEDELNHLSVTGLDNLLELVRQGNFSWIARAVKFVLADPGPELEWFLAKLPSNRLEQLLQAVLEDEYASMPEYQVAAGQVCTARLNRVFRG